MDRSTIRGPTLDLELPIFNQGQARVARAQAQLRLARARLAQLELSSANGVDLAAERVRVLSEVVRIHRDALIPERESVVARSQEEQNFMLIGIFEVIQAKTQEYDAYQGYLEAVRDYWLARVDLMRLVGARLPSEKQVSGTTPSVTQILTPPAMAGMAGMDHSAHGAASAPGSPGPSAPSGMAGMDHGAHSGATAMPGMAAMAGISPSTHRAGPASAHHAASGRTVRKHAKPAKARAAASPMAPGMLMPMPQADHSRHPGAKP